MATVTNKTFHSPYVTIHEGSSSYAEVTDQIVESIQVVSDAANDDMNLTFTPLGSAEVSVTLSSGDTIYGPISKYTITGGNGIADCAIIVHSRSNVTTN
jgi:hypothetical protein